jgi:hypothetical protein
VSVQSSAQTPPPRPKAPAVVAADISDVWEEKFSSQHQKSYWKHKITGEKTWKNPLKLVAKEIAAKAKKALSSGIIKF